MANTPANPDSVTPAPSGSASRAGSAYPAAVDRLMEELTRLPGIGRRGAERLAFHVMKSDEASAMRLAHAIEAVKKSVRHCVSCFSLCDGALCPICSSERRDRTRVLVVEQPKDLIALEETRMYNGLYHVLMGRLSPLDGVGPQDLTVDRLLARVDHPESNPGEIEVEEVILGLNPTVEGDGTGLYLAEQLKSRGVVISRLARGLPTGGSLEYANKAVLADAIAGRRAME